LYFEALHHLLMVVSGKLSRKILPAMEDECGWQVGDGPQGCARPIFELAPVRRRHDLLMVALWLLQDWPTRFERVAKRARVTQSRLTMGEALPYWFESTIRTQLSAGQAGPCVNEVRSAIAYMRARGMNTTASSIGRLLGVRYAKAIRDGLTGYNQELNR
jgi:hypothetical protein